jgi:hypothetical protein
VTELELHSGFKSLLEPATSEGRSTTL